MREKRIHGERAKTRTSDVPKIKYFLLFEGTKTEPRYFAALKDCCNKIGISPLIELIEIERSLGEKTWSNPKQLLDRILLNLNEKSTGNISYLTLLNAMVDCLKKDGQLIKEFTTLLTDFICTKMNKSLKDIVENREASIKTIHKYLESERPRIGILIAKYLDETLDDQNITYEPEIDKICLIVDRDKGSFFEKPENRQYSYVCNTCKENNIQLYVSNPCFEFWLLLHFDEVLSLDKVELLENKKLSTAKKAKTFIENELRKKLGSYNKSRYKTDILMDNIEQAIKNEKNFCETIPELEHSLGSNIGLLIQEMQCCKTENKI